MPFPRLFDLGLLRPSLFGSSTRVAAKQGQGEDPAPSSQLPWYSLTPEAAAAQLQSDPTTGLTNLEAEARLRHYGPNQSPVSHRRSGLRRVIAQLTTWPVALLSGAALLSLATDSPVDAAVIMGVVGLNSIIGYVTESQSERIIGSLRQGGEALVRVLRQGETLTVSAAAIVPGDVLLLQTGQTVAADARLLETQDLTLDESVLTGESLPVAKHCLPLAASSIPLAERHNLVFKGTRIASGQGRALVVGTGAATEIGQIQALVASTERQETPLQRQLGEVSGQLVLLCSGICLAIFAIGALRGHELLSLLKTSISLAVAAIPEGLPAIATTTLALGIQTMRQRQILIRNLNAVETLGAVQVICLDKTGTITHNQMAATQLYLATGPLPLSPEPSPTSPPLSYQPQTALHQLLQMGVLCSDSQLRPLADGRFEIQGSPTENALVRMALTANLEVSSLRQRYPLVRHYRRSDGRNLMSTLHQTPAGRWLLAMKGSPAEVLGRCTEWMVADQVKPLTEIDRLQIARANQQLADQSLRVLALAYRLLPQVPQAGTEAIAAAQEASLAEQALIWLGLVGLSDPIREGVPQLMAAFHQAGIDTVMVTGDQRSTAQAIGQSLNLSRNGSLTIADAYDLAHLKAEDLQVLAQQVHIFARISPADKLNIVRALQAADKIVAMTGDGINDTPALKAANVGLAMGSGQADGVHDVADVVIQDDHLATLIEAISQGRTIYTNIRKAVHFLLATNLSEIMVVAVATLVGLGEPLNAIQLLWLNLVTDVFPGLGLALEPPEPSVLAQPPRPPTEPILKPADFQRITWEAGILSLCALAAYGYALAKYGPGTSASTVAFMGLTLAQVLHTFSCRSETRRWLGSPALLRNPYVEVAIAGSLALQLLPLIVPGLGTLLKIVPLQPVDYLVITLAALLPLLLNESTKGVKSPTPDSSD